MSRPDATQKAGAGDHQRHPHSRPGTHPPRSALTEGAGGASGCGCPGGAPPRLNGRSGGTLTLKVGMRGYCWPCKMGMDGGCTKSGSCGRTKGSWIAKWKLSSEIVGTTSSALLDNFAARSGPSRLSWSTSRRLCNLARGDVEAVPGQLPVSDSLFLALR